jgi:hypothetical protein
MCNKGSLFTLLVTALNSQGQFLFFSVVMIAIEKREKSVVLCRASEWRLSTYRRLFN